MLCRPSRWRLPCLLCQYPCWNRSGTRLPPGCRPAQWWRRIIPWAAILGLRQDDRMIGRDLADVVIDTCLTKAPRGSEKAGRSYSTSKIWYMPSTAWG